MMDEPSGTAESQSRHPRQSHRKRLSKYVRFGPSIILTLVGLGLLIVAFLLLPNQSQSPTPSSPIIYINTSLPIDYLKYQVNVEGPSKYQLSLLLETSSTNASGGNDATVDISIPPGWQFGECVRLGLSGCQRRPVSGSMGGLPGSAGEWTTEVGSTNTGPLDLAITIMGTDFGYTANDVQESVAMPNVKFSNSVNCEMDVVYVGLSGTESYDWSSFPTTLNTTAYISWIEEVMNGIVPARSAVGINHAAQSQDDHYTFIAGALVGVAGGALIGALQEIMHVWTDDFRAARKPQDNVNRE